MTHNSRRNEVLKLKYIRYSRHEFPDIQNNFRCKKNLGNPNVHDPICRFAFADPGTMISSESQPFYVIQMNFSFVWSSYSISFYFYYIYLKSYLTGPFVMRSKNYFCFCFFRFWLKDCFLNLISWTFRFTSRCAQNLFISSRIFHS